MINKLSKHGDDFALILDSRLLERLNIDENTALEISVSGETLIVAAVRDKAADERFEQALTDVNSRYGKALKRLAE